MIDAPSIAEALVDRPALVARLTEALDRGGLMLTAGAGYGKTTVLAQTLAARSGPTRLGLVRDDGRRRGGAAVAGPGRAAAGGHPRQRGRAGGRLQEMPQRVDVPALTLALRTRPGEVAGRTRGGGHRRRRADRALARGAGAGRGAAGRGPARAPAGGGQPPPARRAREPAGWRQGAPPRSARASWRSPRRSAPRCCAARRGRRADRRRGRCAADGHRGLAAGRRAQRGGTGAPGDIANPGRRRRVRLPRSGGAEHTWTAIFAGRSWTPPSPRS